MYLDNFMSFIEKGLQDKNQPLKLDALLFYRCLLELHDTTTATDGNSLLYYINIVY